jgi:glycosyltransferase involved in cell wall biosynthesis
MRIVLICEVFLPKVDGVVGRTLNLIRELQAAGDEVLVCCPAVPESRESPVPLAECRSFPCVSYPDYHIGIPGPDLLCRLREFAPDVVHFINPLAFGFAVCLQLRRVSFRAPVVFSFHTQYGEFVRTYPGLSWLSGILWYLMRSFHNTADVNLTVSQTMLEDLRLRGFERLELWPPAVDSQRFSPQQRDPGMRQRLSGNRPVQSLLLTVSRLAAEKNVGFLTEVLDRVQDGHLAVVGDGPERESLERRFAGRRATFPGCLTGCHLSQAYASSDVFVYASETETMGNVVLEAMSAGLPVVAAAAGGVCSLVQHGRTGFLFTPGRADEAAGYVRQLVENPVLRERMSKAALEDAGSRNWASAVAAVRGSYQQAIQIHAQEPVQRSLSWLAELMSRLLILGFSLCTWRRTAVPVKTWQRNADDGGEPYSERAGLRPSEVAQAAFGPGERCPV